MKISINNKIVDATSEQEAEFLARQKKWIDETTNRKLEQIREIRNKKLSETDYLAMSDNTMSDEIKTYRQSMRNIPQDYSEDKYSELLARDEQGNLTHTVWSKP